LERLLGDALRGKTLADGQAGVLRMAGESAEPERQVLLAVADLFAGILAGGRTHHIVVGGAANLADEAAHWRRETVRRLFEALERESEMLHLLRDVTSTDLSVTIGAEHPATGEWGASIVSAPFRAGETSLGTIGVVGPTAMDYLSVMASVRAVARRLSELATELGE
jgi:heat-inducible transcriptional repressor